MHQVVSQKTMLKLSQQFMLKHIQKITIKIMHQTSHVTGTNFGKKIMVMSTIMSIKKSGLGLLTMVALVMVKQGLHHILNFMLKYGQEIGLRVMMQLTQQYTLEHLQKHILKIMKKNILKFGRRHILKFTKVGLLVQEHTQLMYHS